MRAWLAGAVLMGLAVAQSYQPSCGEALAFGPGTFTDLYVALNDDESELGYDLAAGYWARCKRQDNLRRLQPHPALKTRLEQLRKLYQDLRAAETEIALEYYGGGTLYTHALARSATELEEHLSDLIGLTTRKLGAAQASGFSGAYDYSLGQLDAHTKALRRFTDRQIGQTTRPRWNAAIAKYEAAYRGIIKIAGARKDATSAAILGFASRPLWLEDIIRENQ